MKRTTHGFTKERHRLFIWKVQELLHGKWESMEKKVMNKTFHQGMKTIR